MTRKNLCVGLLRETKPWEKRAPLTPDDAAWLLQRNVDVEVETSASRIFKDTEYKKSGARIVDRFQKATFLLGVKEPDAEDLYEDKIYMVFSHTVKGQQHNMPLLKACLKKNITLIDYEKIVDLHGRRLVYFGRFAGIAGMVDCFHYLGKKLEWKGVENPFLLIKPAYEYASLKAVRHAMAELDARIRKRGFNRKLTPFIIGITGHGNVSGGVQEVLKSLNPVEIHPKDMLRFIRHQKGMSHKVYKIVFLREEKLRSKNGKGFYFEKYLEYPDKFESNLDTYLPYLNMLIHTSYWDKRYPRLITKKMVHRLAKRGIFRLEFIGDISCDVNGSVELTRKATTPDEPTFTYDAKKKKYTEGYKSPGITIFAVDNLPAELPRDASAEFSRLIKDYVYQVAVHGMKEITQHAAIQAELRGAVITEGKKITKGFSYLKGHI